MSFLKRQPSRAQQQEFDKLLDLLSERRADLERALGSAYPEFDRVSVEVGTKPQNYLDGTRDNALALVIKLYVKGRSYPHAEFFFAPEATDEQISAEVESALSKVV